MTKNTQKRRELLRLIEEHPPQSIYRLAQTAGRSYRRVHDHVHTLAEAGVVHLRRTRHNGRRVAIVESIAAQRLRRLDELFAFRQELR